jgi:peptidyl-prolyl cis-trans isomerase D
MLDLLRRKAQSPLIQGTILIIALVFIFWGVGGGYQGRINAVATVNDEAIPYEEFQKAYEVLVTQFRNQFGGNLPKGLLESLDLEVQALEQLIIRTLLRQGAIEMGIMVSDLEVQQAVETMEAFRTNGIFNVEQYKTIISSSGMTTVSFENSIRADLLAGKVNAHLQRFVKLTPLEINEQFEFDNEEINIEYVSFSGSDFKEKVNDVGTEKLQSFYEEQKDNYMTDPQVKLDFLLFPYNSDKKPVVNNEDIESFYRKNFNRYSTPEQRSARHILIKTTEGDTVDALSEKRTRAEQVLEMAKSGEDFAELAKQYSEGPTGPGGGDLGAFGRGRMVKPFDDAVFTMNEGEISDIVESQFGFHVIKLEKIEPAHTRTLEEVKDEIASQLQEEKAGQVAYNSATEAYENIILAGSLDKFSQQHPDVAVKQTDFFPRKSPEKSGFTEGMISEPAFLNAAFGLNKGELSSLIETSKGYAIIFAADKKDPEISLLEDVKEQVQQDYISAKAGTMAQETAESMLSALKEQGSIDLSSEASKYNKTPENSGFITRGRTEGSSLPAQVASLGFELSAESPYPEEVVASNGIFYVFRVKEKRPSSPDLFSEKEDEFRTGLLERKKNTLLGSWLTNVREKADIEINEQFL